MYIIKHTKNNVYLAKIFRNIYHFESDIDNALKFKRKRDIDKKFKTDKFEIIEV